MRVTVLKAFLVRGERQEVDSEIDLDDPFAREMVTLQRVRPVLPVAAPAGPMTTESAGGIVAGRKRKGA